MGIERERDKEMRELGSVPNRQRGVFQETGFCKVGGECRPGIGASSRGRVLFSRFLFCDQILLQVGFCFVCSLLFDHFGHPKD